MKQNKTMKTKNLVAFVFLILSLASFIVSYIVLCFVDMDQKATCSETVNVSLSEQQQMCYRHQDYPTPHFSRLKTMIEMEAFGSTQRFNLLPSSYNCFFNCVLQQLTIQQLADSEIDPSRSFAFWMMSIPLFVAIIAALALSV